MSITLTCMDQTLQQGLLKRLSYREILLMVQSLQNAGIENMDVVWQDVKDYGFPNSIYNRLRVLIPWDIAVLNEVVQQGFKKIIIAYEHQSAQTRSAELRSFLEGVRQRGMCCSLSIENASNMQLEDFQTLWQDLRGEVLDSVIYKDADGLLEPQTAIAIFQQLIAMAPYPLEFHGHDVLGLGTANTLSAMQTGIDRVATAICGVGNCPHAPFEQVVMAAKHLLHLHSISISPNLAVTCSAILTRLGKSPRLDQPIIGDNVFAHESGLHVFGIMKNASIYEAFSPEEVGLKRHLILGRHSGISFLKALLHRLGIVLSEQNVHQLLACIHKLVLKQKGPVGYQQFCELCQRGCCDAVSQSRTT